VQDIIDVLLSMIKSECRPRYMLCDSSCFVYSQSYFIFTYFYSFLFLERVTTKFITHSATTISTVDGDAGLSFTTRYDTIQYYYMHLKADEMVSLI